MTTTTWTRGDLPGWHQSQTRKGRVQYVWRVNRTTACLVRQHAGRVLSYRDLPIQTRQAIAHYMAFEREIWDYPPRLDESGTTNASWFTRFQLSQRFFVNRYGDLRFGYVEVPTKQLLKADCQYQHRQRDNPLFVDSPPFEEIHRWYLRVRETFVYVKLTWPVILNGFEDDEDWGLIRHGWDLLHEYVARRFKTVPCVWYPRYMQENTP